MMCPQCKSVPCLTSCPLRTTVKALDRGDAVNLARNVMEFSECPALTPKGQLCLAEAVLKMDAELTRLSTRSESGSIKPFIMGCDLAAAVGKVCDAVLHEATPTDKKSAVHPDAAWPFPTKPPADKVDVVAAIADRENSLPEGPERWIKQLYALGVSAVLAYGDTNEYRLRRMEEARELEEKLLGYVRSVAPSAEGIDVG